MGLNNPVPQSIGKESRKAARILASFIKPNQVINYDEVIPPYVLQHAHGLAVITVLKAGFLFSGRAGSGLIVARLPDGTWSPPSACVIGGAGAGGMVGIELTDFIFVLNSEQAVDVFARSGSLTLGGNISLAAGPLGRSGEAGGSASTGGAAAIFSYSKTKGLYAGVSLEGSVLLERREENRKFYGRDCCARDILAGRVRPPRAVEPLFRVLDSRAFRSDLVDDDYGSDFYDDIPDPDSMSLRSSYTAGRRGAAYDDFDDDDDDDYPRHRSSRYAPARYSRHGGSSTRRDEFSRHARLSGKSSHVSRPSGRYRDHSDFDDDDGDVYPRRGRDDREHDNDLSSRMRRTRIRDDSWDSDLDRDRGRIRDGDRYRDRDRDDFRSNGLRSNRRDYGDRDDFRSSGTGRSRSSIPRDASGAVPASAGVTAIALYSFNGEQEGDLPFRKGDIIQVVEKSDSVDDWWTGELKGVRGIFPANYVEIV